LKNLDDSTLIKEWRNTSDRRILGELFSRYSHLVLGVCVKYLKNQEESKDAVMEIFEKLHQDLGKHEITYFKSWLYSVARNHCLMQLRKKGLQTTDNELINYENLIHHSESIDEDLEDTQQETKALNFCLEQLKMEQKRCVELFYLQEKSYKEVSEATGFDFNAVKSHVQNGKLNLKKCLENR
jgi:RNA polymerase sigma factor (sigma-70 family)